MADEIRLTNNQRSFVNHFLMNGNQYEAYKASYSHSNYKESSIHRKASEIRKNPAVDAAIRREQDRLSKKASFTALNVIEHWIEIATADPRELMQMRRTCCRYCYGKNHEYQWTPREYADAVAIVVDYNATKRNEQSEKEIPDDSGGTEFNHTLPPHTHCIECRGEGIESVWFADVRNLSPQAARLYAGVKQTPNGIQILTRSQDVALTNLAKVLGMFTETIDLNILNGITKPANEQLALPHDPIEAARFYQALMKSRK